MRLLVVTVGTLEGPEIPVNPGHDSRAVVSLPGACVHPLQRPLLRQRRAGCGSLLMEEGGPYGSRSTRHQAVVLHRCRFGTRARMDATTVERH